VLLGIIFICIVGILLYNFAFYYNSDTVTIKTAEDTDFSIKIENRLIGYEYYYAQFVSELSEDEVIDEISSQYETVFYDSEMNQIVFSYKNQIYSIDNYENSHFLWTDRNKYWLKNNIIDISIDNENYLIPVPLNCIHDSVSFYSEQIKLNCNFDTLSVYYKNFDNANISENSIVLMYADYNIVLTISDEEFLTIAIT
ncbi:MAG: hypothetical protein LUE12_00065, partial [Ruminococcus sp.]|nr:hypothetical protein [Ruminococcus sp.]